MYHKLMTLAALLMLLTGCDQYDAAQSNNTNSDIAVTEGAELFSTFNCITCHGNDGRTPALGVSRIIAEIDAIEDIENALYALRSGAPGRNQAMISIAESLSDEDIAALSAYIQTL